jgi:hypothetical protein
MFFKKKTKEVENKYYYKAKITTQKEVYDIFGYYEKPDELADVIRSNMEYGGCFTAPLIKGGITVIDGNDIKDVWVSEEPVKTREEL